MGLRFRFGCVVCLVAAKQTAETTIGTTRESGFSPGGFLWCLAALRSTGAFLLHPAVFGEPLVFRYVSQNFARGT